MSVLLQKLARAVAVPRCSGYPQLIMKQVCPNPSAPKLAGSFCQARTKATAAVAAVTEYSSSLKAIHWLMAGGTLSCFGLVQVAQRVSDNKLKGELMMLHKSIGLLLLGGIGARVLVKLSSKAPGALPGSFAEHLVANLSHVLMYGFMFVMPMTGVAMGYYGGKGLPFFGMTIPGASGENKDGKFAGKMFKLHKQAGQWFELFLPVHVGAAFLHLIRGHEIFKRISTAGAFLVVGGAGATGGYVWNEYNFIPYWGMPKQGLPTELPKLPPVPANPWAAPPPAKAA